MNIIFVEPVFPSHQREFVRALRQVGGNVIGIGESPRNALDSELAGWMLDYLQVDSVCDEEEMTRAVKFAQRRMWIDRLEATVESHMLPVAKVRDRCTIPGLSVRTCYHCRDKPAMKAVFRDAQVPCAQSIESGDVDEIRRYAKEIGFPLIIKPRGGTGAAITTRVDNREQMETALLEANVGPKPTQQGRVAIEEFIQGHEAFYDTITINGQVAHEFISHYNPNLLDAMRNRWISPQFICTNRIDLADGYDEVKTMGRRVIGALQIETSATHMEWFWGDQGLKVSEIACRPPGVRAWDLYAAANEIDIYREWATAIVHGHPGASPTRKYSAGIIALRPDRDGHISAYEGLQEIETRFGEWFIDCHLPEPGTPTQPIEAGYLANAWIRVKHPDYDHLRFMLDEIGKSVQVRSH